MRYLGIIFSIYMTILAVLPCRDSNDFGDLITTYSSSNTRHSDDGKAGEETCTPFCTCSCCSTVRTITPDEPVIVVVIQEVIRTFSEPVTQPLVEQSISIWQPPQIALYDSF